MTEETNQVLVVIPAFNEALNVGRVVTSLVEDKWDVLVIDDGSNDDTAEVAKSAGAKVLRLPINLGVGGALRCGFKYAIRHNYSHVVQVDADGQHPVNEISELLDVQKSGNYDLVLGSRFRHSELVMSIGLVRRMTMKILAFFATRACNTEITDATSGFRVISNKLLKEFSETFPAYYLGDTYEALVAAGRNEYTVVEVPARLVERQHGNSSATVIQAIQFTLKGLLVALLGIHIKISPKSTSNSIEGDK